MEQITKGVYVETAYAGVNVGVIVTPKGLVCIDVPSYPKDARTWATRLHQLSPYPIQYIILTDYHGDRILNSRWLNAPIIAHQRVAEKLNSYDKRYPQPLIDSLIARNSDCGRELINNPVERPMVTFSDDLTLYVGEQMIHLRHVAGPTDGSVWIHLSKCGILFTGDSVVVNEHPFLNDANSVGWLAELKGLLGPAYEVDKLVPGRGPVSNKKAIEPIITYLETMHECIWHHLQRRAGRETLSQYIPTLWPLFPAGNWPREWLEKMIRQGLEHTYDQLKQKGPDLMIIEANK